MFYSLASVTNSCRYSVEKCVSGLVTVHIILPLKLIVHSSNFISSDFADALIVSILVTEAGGIWF